MGDYDSVRKSSSPDFKSRGEVQIARLLDRQGIRYLYELPLAVSDRGKVRIWYPDFQLPEYGIIMEYFGAMGKGSYDDQVKHKMEVYGQMGLEGVFLKEPCFQGDWPGRILSQIEGILQNRLSRFQLRSDRRDCNRQHRRSQ